MKRWFLLLSALVLMLGGCGRVQNERFVAPPDDAPLQIEATIPDELTTGSEAKIQIRLSEQGRPIEGATVLVEGNMAHAGMEPLRVRAEPNGVAGEYIAPLSWTMSGGWIVTVQATLPDGQSAERTFDGIEVRQR